MAKYFYNKYKTIRQYYIIRWIPTVLGTYAEYPEMWGYESYNLIGNISVNNPYNRITPSDDTKIYLMVGGKLTRRWYSNGYAYRDEAEVDYNLIKGALVETIVAEDGIYPNDGISGDYWYVKKGLAFPELKIKIDGQLKISENGWVKVDNQLKTIDKIWTEVDGQLKEV